MNWEARSESPIRRFRLSSVSELHSDGVRLTIERLTDEFHVDDSRWMTASATEFVQLRFAHSFQSIFVLTLPHLDIHKCIV